MKINKKLLTFGILGIFAIALVTAGLVGYLSNKVQADVEVESPMEQLINDGSSGWIQGPISFLGVKGGETITFYVKTKNLADVSITGETENIVTNPGITCDDFESVIVSTNTNGAGYGTEYDLINLPNLCSQDGYNKVIFSYGPTPSITWDIGQVDVNKIVATFKTDAVGTYAFTSQIVPLP